MGPLQKEGGGREGCTDPGPVVRALTLPLCTSVSPLARRDQKSPRRASQRPARGHTAAQQSTSGGPGSPAAGSWGGGAGPVHRCRWYVPRSAPCPPPPPSLTVVSTEKEKTGLTVSGQTFAIAVNSRGSVPCSRLCPRAHPPVPCRRARASAWNTEHAPPGRPLPSAERPPQGSKQAAGLGAPGPHLLGPWAHLSLLALHPLPCGIL